jgi:uncharacterized damage-inducible protein DinB
MFNVTEFLDHFERVRQRTRTVAGLIPADHVEWTYKPGAFTLGDIVRHLATAERDMWAETVSGRPSRYTTHGRELADGRDAVLAFMDRLHAEAMPIFRALTPEMLAGKCTTPGGTALSTWKWLRAMEEHEIHHRGQLYLMLGMLGVPTPPLFGRTSEEVRAVGANR